MTIPPISGITPIPAAPGPGPAAGADAPGFGESVTEALRAVSDAEHEASAIAEEIAAGGDREVHELMVAMTKASLSVDLLVQVRNKAVEAYQEIMRMQI